MNEKQATELVRVGKFFGVAITAVFLVCWIVSGWWSMSFLAILTAAPTSFLFFYEEGWIRLLEGRDQ